MKTEISVYEYITGANGLDVSAIEDERDRLDAMIPDDDDEENPDPEPTQTKINALNLIEHGAGDRWATLNGWLQEIEDQGAGNIDYLYTPQGLDNDLEATIEHETRGIPHWLVVDEEATKDNLMLDYTGITVDGWTFYYR